MDYKPSSEPGNPDARPEDGLPEQSTHAVFSTANSYPENKRDLKHSGPGIASFVIALITFISYAICFVLIGVQATSIIQESRSSISGSSETIMYLGLTVLILAAFNVIGAVTGIIGLTLRSRRKIFAVIGTIINGIILLLFMLLISTVLVNAGSY